MNEEDIRKIVQEEIRNNASRNVYSQSSIPIHAHTGLDSIQVDGNNLAYASPWHKLPKPSVLPTAKINGAITTFNGVLYIFDGTDWVSVGGAASWLSFSGQTSLTGNKSGSFKLTTTDDITAANIITAGKVDGVDVSTHTHGGADQGGTVAHGSLGSVGASDHHSSTSSGLNITPASVNTGYIHMGDVNAYDILPYANAYGSLGYSNRKWDRIYCNTQTAGNHITGDMSFSHKGQIVFRIDENPEFLSFYNKDNELVMKLGANGDLLIKGNIKNLT